MQTSLVHHVIGDVTEPIRKPAIIAHVCNNVGGWGRGVVVPIGKKYPRAKKDYKALGTYLLSEFQIVPINDDLFIANMIAQDGLHPKDGVPPIRYESLEACLEHVQQWADAYHMTVHMPRIGAGLAQGSWRKIEDLISSTARVDTYIYTLEKEKGNWPPCTYEELA